VPASQAIRVLDLRSVDDAGGGADQIILRTAAGADPQRLKVTVCCLRAGRNHAYDIDRRAAHLGIDYCEVGQRSPWDPGVWRSLGRIVRDRRPAIVHAHDYKASFYAMRLARAQGVTPVATAHGWSGHHWRERFVYYPAEKLILRRFPAVIAVSTQVRDTLVRWGCKPQRVHVVLNGVDPSEFHRRADVRARIRESLGFGDGEVVVGAIGRLGPEKRFDVLLETMAILFPRRPELRLVIIGGGTLEHDLNGQIRRLGISDRCRLLGYREDILDLYQALDVLVQSSDHEGTPTVVVEAMAMEIPVVATAVGGTAELVADGVHGLLAPRRSPASLASAIQRTLDDREATAARVAEARRRVEGELSFDRRMQKLQAIYEQLLFLDGCRRHDSAQSNA
jgi:glycosyltransferase involved in cell wall biosynthesis